jgi:hypothetical protein
MLQYRVAEEGESLGGSRFIRYEAIERLKNGATKTVTVHRWAELIAKDGSLSDGLTQVLRGAPFLAFYFETKGVTATSAPTNSFEFVLVDAPRLASFAESSPDSQSFRAHFAKCPLTTCCTFPNLGGDAMLVAPIQRNPTVPLVTYSHLAKFVREAPTAQAQDLWQLTANTYRERWKEQPVWLSTEGSGVAWLHMRLDSQPKYYHYKQFATI